MAGINHSVSAPARPANPGQLLWDILCRAALKSVDWAADACGAKNAQTRVERSELLVGLGSLPHAGAPSVIDWAGLNEVDRARVALELTPSAHAARSHRH